MREPGGRLRPVVCLADAKITVFGVQRNIRCFQGIFLALLIAGLTGFCGMARLLKVMPWNRHTS